MKNLICFLMFAVSVTLLFSSEKSIDTLIQEAEHGDAEAQYNLGAIYYKGLGVPKDYFEAVKWYRKAAEQGLAVAQFRLGIMYWNGLGIPLDSAEAVKWYRKAAEQGDGMAQFNLGLAYALGIGVSQDYISAYMWCNIAESQDYASAYVWDDIAEPNPNAILAKAFENIANEMTSDDIEQAKEKAKICMESNYKQCD